MIDLQSHAEQIVARYPAGRQRSALIPLLRLAQERDGYLTKSGIEEIGHILGLTPAEVTAVATFYTMLYTKPKGRHVISICHNLACTLAGAEEVIAAIEKELRVECGHTTADGEFTLERAECLAFCDKAPMMQIDYDEMIGPLTTTAALQFLERLKAGLKGPAESPPASSLGEKEKERNGEEEPLLVESISLSEEEEEWLHREGDEKP